MSMRLSNRDALKRHCKIEPFMGWTVPSSQQSSCQPDAATAVVGVLGSANTGAGVFQGVPLPEVGVGRPDGVAALPSSICNCLYKVDNCNLEVRQCSSAIDQQACLKAHGCSVAN